MRRLRIAVAVLLISVLLTTSAAAQGQLRLLIMDGINLEHLTQGGYPNFTAVMNEGALGLVNVNTAGSRSRENSCITMNCGSRALGPAAEEIFAVGTELETGAAGEIHARRTGISPSPDALVMLGVAQIAAVNGDLQHKAQFGLLGDRLKDAGVTVAALISGDADHVLGAAAAIVADGDGVVQKGRVMPWQVGLAAPFGRQSDLTAFITAFALFEDTDMLVVDLGDTSLVEDYLPQVVLEKQEEFRFQALSRLDTALGELLKIHGEDDLLLVVGLRGNRVLAEDEGRLLAPILAYGRGFEGLLTSATTRRRGVVASIDVTGTILEFFGLTQAGIYGQPLRGQPQTDPQSYLLKREREMAAVYMLRPPLIKGLIAAIIVLIGLALAAYFYQWRRLYLLRLLLLMILVSPLALLLLAAFPASWLLLPAWIFFTLLSALLLSKMNASRAFFIVGSLTAFLIIADALIGAPLQKTSVLGYDPIAGCRYYGVGNEYMGALLGSVLLALSRSLTTNKRLAAVVLGIVVLVLLLPGVGANFGGALAALVGFTFALTGLGFLKEKKNRLKVAAVFGGGLILLVLANLWGAQSHVGRFLTALVEEPGILLQVVGRKLAMNWRLIRWSLWSKAFAALFIAAVGIIFSRRRPLARRLGSLWPQARGALAAAVAALVFNDSGIVAAAMTLLYITLPLLCYWFSSSSFATAPHSW